MALVNKRAQNMKSYNDILSIGMGESQSNYNTQGINSAAHSATLKGKINALEVIIMT